MAAVVKVIRYEVPEADPVASLRAIRGGVQGLSDAVDWSRGVVDRLSDSVGNGLRRAFDAGAATLRKWRQEAKEALTEARTIEESLEKGRRVVEVFSRAWHFLTDEIDATNFPGLASDVQGLNTNLDRLTEGARSLGQEFLQNTGIAHGLNRASSALADGMAALTEHTNRQNDAIRRNASVMSQLTAEQLANIQAMFARAAAARTMRDEIRLSDEAEQALEDAVRQVMERQQRAILIGEAFVAQQQRLKNEAYEAAEALRQEAAATAELERLQAQNSLTAKQLQFSNAQQQQNRRRAGRGRDEEEDKVGETEASLIAKQALYRDFIAEQAELEREQQLARIEAINNLAEKTRAYYAEQAELELQMGDLRKRTMGELSDKQAEAAAEQLARQQQLLDASQEAVVGMIQGAAEAASEGGVQAYLGLIKRLLRASTVAIAAGAGAKAAAGVLGPLSWFIEIAAASAAFASELGGSGGGGGDIGGSARGPQAITNAPTPTSVAAPDTPGRAFNFHLEVHGNLMNNSQTQEQLGELMGTLLQRNLVRIGT